MSDSVVVAPVVPVVRDIAAVAGRVAQIIPTYKVRAGNAKTFVNLTLIEDEKINWKKGLIYLLCRFSKGVNLELWLYSTKGGAHLSQFNDKFRALASDSIKCEKLQHAVKLRIQLLDSDSDEVVDAKIKAFTDAIEPTVTEVRALVPAPVVSKKETKAESKVEAKTEETPAVEAPTAPAASAPKAKAKSKAKK
jgi:hypothetical protein